MNRICPNCLVGLLDHQKYNLNSINLPRTCSRNCGYISFNPNFNTKQNSMSDITQTPASSPSSPIAIPKNNLRRNSIVKGNSPSSFEEFSPGSPILC